MNNRLAKAEEFSLRPYRRSMPEAIRKYSKTFGGQLKDADVMKLAGISGPTYYKYKREISEAMVAEGQS